MAKHVTFVARRPSIGGWRYGTLSFKPIAVADNAYKNRVNPKPHTVLTHMMYEQQLLRATRCLPSLIYDYNLI